MKPKGSLESASRITLSYIKKAFTSFVGSQEVYLSATWKGEQAFKRWTCLWFWMQIRKSPDKMVSRLLSCFFFFLPPFLERAHLQKSRVGILRRQSVWTVHFHRRYDFRHGSAHDMWLPSLSFKPKLAPGRISPSDSKSRASSAPDAARDRGSLAVVRHNLHCSAVSMF